MILEKINTFKARLIPFSVLNDTREEDIYLQEKGKFLVILDNVLSHPDGLYKILAPLASSNAVDSKQYGISFAEKLQAGASIITYITNHFSDLASIDSSSWLYIEEAQKFRRLLNKQEKYNHRNPPFFIKLLRDKDLEHFLEEKGCRKLTELIDLVLPVIISILLKEFGKIDAIEKELTAGCKGSTTLLEKERQLQKLITKNRKCAKPKLEQKITILEKEIAHLRTLQSEMHDARLIYKLKQQGIDSAYINKHLLPILTESIKEIFSSPRNLLEIINLMISMSISQDISEKTSLLEQILIRIDLAKILANDKLKAFLDLESQTLVRIAKIVIESNDQFTPFLKRFKITEEFMANLILILSQIISAALQHADIINKLYKDLIIVIVDLVKLAYIKSYHHKLSI